MSNKQVLEFVEDWLDERKIKVYFENKEKRYKRYVKLKEEDLYKLCYKLVSLIKDNME